MKLNLAVLGVVIAASLAASAPAMVAALLAMCAHEPEMPRSPVNTMPAHAIPIDGISTDVRRFSYADHDYIRFGGWRYTAGYVHDPDCACMK